MVIESVKMIYNVILVCTYIHICMYSVNVSLLLFRLYKLYSFGILVVKMCMKLQLSGTITTNQCMLSPVHEFFCLFMSQVVANHPFELF